MRIRIKLRPTPCVIALLVALFAGSLSANWEATLSKEPAGNFPELRPLRASYRFGWSGLTAATGDVHFSKPTGDKFQFDGTGRTIGFVRDRKSTRLNSSHGSISYAVFCLKKN